MTVPINSLNSVNNPYPANAKTYTKLCKVFSIFKRHTPYFKAKDKKEFIFTKNFSGKRIKIHRKHPRNHAAPFQIARGVLRRWQAEVTTKESSGAPLASRNVPVVGKHVNAFANTASDRSARVTDSSAAAISVPQICLESDEKTSAAFPLIPSSCSAGISILTFLQSEEIERKKSQMQRFLALAQSSLAEGSYLAQPLGTCTATAATASAASSINVMAVMMATASVTPAVGAATAGVVPVPALTLTESNFRDGSVHPQTTGSAYNMDGRLEDLMKRVMLHCLNDQM